MNNEEIISLRKNFFALLADHGNAWKHYNNSINSSASDRVIVKAKKILHDIENKLLNVDREFKNASMSQSLAAFLADSSLSDGIPEDRDKPPSSPNDSDSSQSDEHENGTNPPEQEHSSASSEISVNDKENNIDKEAEEKATAEQAERDEKDDFLASFGLIHKDKFEEMQAKRKVFRKCRANANPHYSRAGIETKKKVAECMKIQSKLNREQRENSRKEKAKNTVVNYANMMHPKLIKFSNVPLNNGFKQIKNLTMDKFSCAICRFTLNGRARKTMVACGDCKTLYHQVCISPDNNPDELKCSVCSDIIQRGVDQQKLCMKSPLFVDVYSLSHEVIKQLSHQATILRSNTSLKRRLEEPDSRDTKKIALTAVNHH